MKATIVFVALLLVSHSSAAQARGTNGCNDAAPRPMVDFELGAPLERLEPVRVDFFGETEPTNGVWVAGDLADVNITHRGKLLSFPSIGGMTNTAMILNSDIDRQAMASIHFIINVAH